MADHGMSLQQQIEAHAHIAATDAVREETPIERETRESYAAAVTAMETQRPLTSRHLAADIGAHRLFVHNHFPSRTQDERDEIHRRGRASLTRRYSELGGKLFEGVRR